MIQTEEKRSEDDGQVDGSFSRLLFMAIEVFVCLGFFESSFFYRKVKKRRTLLDFMCTSTIPYKMYTCNMYVVYAFDLVAVIFFSFFIQHSIERKPKVKKEIEENIVRFDA